jgi:hypothetical protein
MQSSYADIAEDAVNETPDMLAGIMYAYDRGFTVSSAVAYTEYSSNDVDEDRGIHERARIAARYAEVK